MKITRIKEDIKTLKYTGLGLLLFAAIIMVVLAVAGVVSSLSTFALSILIAVFIGVWLGNLFR